MFKREKMKNWKNYLIILFLFCGNSIAKADAFEEGMKAAGQGDYTKAFQLISVAAKAGSAEAKFKLSGFYAKGLGVQQNLQEGSRLLRESAEQGYAVAQYDLGVISRRGTGAKYGIPQSDTEAMRWYRLAAAQGYTPAMNNMGFLYLTENKSVPTDSVIGYMWFYIAAEMKNSDAIKNTKLLEKHLTKEQIQDAQIKANNCTKTKFKECG
jgi:TPR repeat protein